MEPDGTRVFRDIIERFNKTSPESPVRLVEGPPSSDTREDMYSTAFLAGGSGYDIVYCDVVWVPKFAAAGWLLDLTDRLSPADGDDFLPADLEAGRYNGRLYRIPAFTDAGLLYYRSDLIRRPGTIAEIAAGLVHAAVPPIPAPRLVRILEQPASSRSHCTSGRRARGRSLPGRRRGSSQGR